VSANPAAADVTRTRHVSARLPEVLADQVELVRVRQRLRHYSDGLAYVLDRGLDAIANERRKPERLETMVARIDDLAVTIVAILNLAHELDAAAVEETRRLVLEQLAARRTPPHAHSAPKLAPQFAGFGAESVS
jgi:hypothetical protein